MDTSSIIGQITLMGITMVMCLQAYAFSIKREVSGYVIALGLAASLAVFDAATGNLAFAGAMLLYIMAFAYACIKRVEGSINR